MGDITDLMTQVGDVQLSQVQAIEQQLAFFRFVKTHHQSRQGAFARAAAADDADPLAGLDAEADIGQRCIVLAVVAEGHADDIQRALQLRALQRPLFGIAFLWQRHQRVGAFHGQLRLLVAGDQTGDLAQWRQHAAAEHVAGHQCADAEVAGDDAIDTGNDGRHAGKLLDEQRTVGGQRREVTRMAVEAGEGAMGTFPLVLALAFGAAGLEGFQAAEGFDQQGLAFGTEAEALLHGVAQPHLYHHGENDRDRKRQHRNHHQPATEQADHHQHEHYEGQVDEAGEGDGGEAIPAGPGSHECSGQNHRWSPAALSSTCR